MALPEDDMLANVSQEIIAAARQYMHRENTDFIGRMGERGCEVDQAVEDNDLEAFKEAIDDLAAMALAQAAMARTPGYELI